MISWARLHPPPKHGSGEGLAVARRSGNRRQTFAVTMRTAVPGSRSSWCRFSHLRTFPVHHQAAGSIIAAWRGYRRIQASLQAAPACSLCATNGPRRIESWNLHGVLTSMILMPLPPANARHKRHGLEDSAAILLEVVRGGALQCTEAYGTAPRARRANDAFGPSDCAAQLRHSLRLVLAGRLTADRQDPAAEAVACIQTAGHTRWGEEDPLRAGSSAHGRFVDGIGRRRHRASGPCPPSWGSCGTPFRAHLPPPTPGRVAGQASASSSGRRITPSSPELHHPRSTDPGAKDKQSNS